MPDRQPVASDFYRGDCCSQIESFVNNYKLPSGLPPELKGAILPHAGWIYSGAIMAKTLYTLSKHCRPETCIIFGTDHTGVSKHALYPAGTWVTPLGELDVDEKIVKILVDALPDILISSASAHRREHSIEVLTPMIKYFWPNVKIVPITVKPEKSSIRLGTKVAEVLSDTDQDVAYLASTDLTHYGLFYGISSAGSGDKGYTWLRNNDWRMIDRLLVVETEQILPEANAHRNACGAGAITALLAAVSVLGVEKGYLVDYITSHDVMPEKYFTSGVGYVGVVY